MDDHLLGNRNFRLLWTGSTISALGSWLLVIAAPVQVYRLTGSTLATGLTLAVEALPAMVIGPWAGALVDRWNRRTTIAVTEVTCAAAMALLLFATTPDRIGLLYLALLVENVAIAFGRPAVRAILPGLVGTGPALAAANSYTAFTGAAMRLAAPPLGTFLLTTTGWRTVIAVNLASYLVSGALTAAIATVRPDLPAAGVDSPRRIIRERIIHELLAGLRQVGETPVLRGLLVAGWGYWTANAALTALLVPFLVTRLDSRGADVGYLIAGLGVGYLVGTAASRSLLARFATRPIVVTAYTVVGLCFLVLFNAPTFATATVAAAASGIPGAIAMVVTQHRVQTATPDAMLGRVGAAFYAGDATAAVTGAVAGPALVAATDLGIGLNVFSGAIIGVAALAAHLLPRDRPPI